MEFDPYKGPRAGETRMEPSHNSVSKELLACFPAFFSLFPLSIHCIYPLSLFIAFLEFLPDTKNIKKKKKRMKENVLHGDPLKSHFIQMK